MWTLCRLALLAMIAGLSGIVPIDPFVNVAIAQSTDEVRLRGTIVNVTLYRQQAMVTREIKLEPGVKVERVIVEGLPLQVNSESLFAEGDATIVVRATQFQRRPKNQSDDQSIQAQHQEIASIIAEQQQVASQEAVLNSQSEYLSKLEAFVATTAMGELSHGVLNAETLKSMAEFQFKQRDEIAKRKLELQTRTTDLGKALELAQRQLAELTDSESRDSLEAVVFLAQSGDGAGSFRLSYLVNGCGWSPSYALRAKDEAADATLEYSSLIHQFSGEDWSNVSLTLSTASPMLSAMRPALAAHRVVLSGEAESNGKQDQLAQAYNTSFANQVQANNAIQTAIDFSGNIRANYTLNQAIEDLATLELNADLKLLKNVVAENAALAEQPSISYSLPARVTLHNRRDQQIVRIANLSLPSSIYLVATPILTNLVYREGELSNKSQFDLLAGPISIYLNDQFVGRSEVPLVSRGQKFVVGLGADAHLRAHREVLDRTEEVQGGNKKISIRYRLKVENFRDTAATVRLLDRVPLAGQGADIKIALASNIPELSKDAIYQEVERPEGILRWDVEVPAVGQSSSIDYGYSIEFDRQFSLTKAQNSHNGQQEFEQFMLKRNRY